MREMASYLGASYNHVALTGGAKHHVMCSNTREDRLEQLEPCVEDWHCVMNLMILSRTSPMHKILVTCIPLIFCS